MTEPTGNTEDEFVVFDIAEQIMSRVRRKENVDLESEYRHHPNLQHRLRQIVEQALANEVSGTVVPGPPEDLQTIPYEIGETLYRTGSAGRTLSDHSGSVPCGRSRCLGPKNHQ